MIFSGKLNPVDALGKKSLSENQVKTYEEVRRGLICCHRPIAIQKEKCSSDRQHENSHEVILHGAWFWCVQISGYSDINSQFS